MCGIAGVAHSHGVGPVSRDVIERMCAAMRHRGPDERGVHVSGPIGLGMQRLSIIDVGGSHQPIFNEDRSKAIVFNGEIYNYRELRRELLSRGHVFQTDGDTETILHLYEDTGADCVKRLRGMFSFAIWDANARTLFLARDRFGIKPLYVTRSSWGMAFASELKALHAAGLVSSELDWEALDAYFQLGYIPAPASPFRAVKKLDPGHTLLWRESGEISVNRYWDLPEDAIEPPRNLEEQVLEWIDESVAAHMVSDVPVAAFLSGGLDSSAVVSSMTMSGERPHAFTARYVGSGAAQADESTLAANFAKRYGAQLTVVDIEPDISGLLESIVFALDEPHADDSAIPTWSLSKVVGSSYKVALTGVGGDELFAGYWRHIGIQLGQAYDRVPSPLRRAAAAMIQAVHEPKNGGMVVDRAKRFLRTAEAEFPDRFLSYLSPMSGETRHSIYASPLQQSISGNAARSRLQNLYLRGGAREGLAGGLYLDYKTFLPDDVLALSDRIAMAHSLEIRVPLVDHKLIERVFGLPDQAKVRWCVKKLLLKRALKPRLPPDHIRAPKRGFVGPTSSWLRGELKPMLIDELSPSRLDRMGYFDSRVTSRFLDEHFSRRHNHERVLWAMLCFSTWHRLYVETPAPRPYDPAPQTVQVG